MTSGAGKTAKNTNITIADKDTDRRVTIDALLNITDLITPKVNQK